MATRTSHGASPEINTKSTKYNPTYDGHASYMASCQTDPSWPRASLTQDKCHALTLDACPRSPRTIMHLHDTKTYRNTNYKLQIQIQIQIQMHSPEMHAPGHHAPLCTCTTQKHIEIQITNYKLQITNTNTNTNTNALT